MKIKTREMTLAAVFAALTAVGAYLAVPLTPDVPFTLQLFFVLLAGALLGPVTGPLSQAVYLCLGLVFPVYAGGGVGLGHLFGPRGGFLWGFVAAAFITGLFSQQVTRGNKKGKRAFLWNVSGMLLGLLAIYLGGVFSLSLVVGYSWKEAVAVGVVPFIPLDIVKVFIAAILAGRLQRETVRFWI